jgi:DNA primase
MCGRYALYRPKQRSRAQVEYLETDQRVSQRTGKIFFDYGMNARVKTLITPYSVRGVVGAPVAMPIEWDDLKDAAPMNYTMANVPQIIDRRGDLWADILSRKQDVQRVLASSGNFLLRYATDSGGARRPVKNETH